MLSVTSMDMRNVDKHQFGLVRPLARWAEATQRRSLAAAGVDRVVSLADERDEDVLGRIRVGDAVAVYLLHLLADRDRLGVHPRTSLFWWLRHLAERRAVIVETGTGRRADLVQISDYPVLWDMVAEAVETITRGTRGRAIVRRARENGAAGGRQPFDETRNREAVEAIHYAPPDKRLTGAAYRKALRRLGWSRAMAYRFLQGRDGRLD